MPRLAPTLQHVYKGVSRPCATLCNGPAFTHMGKPLTMARGAPYTLTSSFGNHCGYFNTCSLRRWDEGTTLRTPECSQYFMKFQLGQDFLYQENFLKKKPKTSTASQPRSYMPAKAPKSRDNSQSRLQAPRVKQGAC